MKASARIQVTLDVPIEDVFAEQTNLAQVRRQAIDSGRQRLAKMLDGILDENVGVRVIGEPRVTIVLVEDL